MVTSKGVLQTYDGRRLVELFLPYSIISSNMIIGSKAPGRPYYVADMPFRFNDAASLYQEFAKAAKSFNYRDVVALSRALNMTERTIYAWRYNERYPRRFSIMLDIIEWYKQGKPKIKHYQDTRHGKMF